MQDKLGDLTRLLHVADAIEEIKLYTQDTDFEKFADASMMKNACIRQLEIIGEAFSRISEEIKEKHDDIEWRQIVGLRNILIHQYFGVDDKILWDIISLDLVDLEEQVARVIKELEGSP